MKSDDPKRVRAKVRKVPKSSELATFDSISFLLNAGSGHFTETYQRAESIYRQDGPADAVYYIKHGKVTISVMSDVGKEAIIARLGVGEFFGEGCLAGQIRRMSSAVASGQAVIVRIAKDAMVQMLHKETRFAEMFTAYLLSRNAQVEGDLIDQLFNSVERRLARLLLQLANFGKEGKMQPVIPKISQDVLAARVGTTPSHIEFFMKKFSELGLIDYSDDGGEGDKTLQVHTSLLNVVVRD